MSQRMVAVLPTGFVIDHRYATLAMCEGPITGADIMPAIRLAMH